MKKILTIFLPACVLLLSVLIYGGYLTFGMAFDVNQKMTNSEGVDAVYSTGSVDATTSVVHRIQLETIVDGKHIQATILLADSTDNIKMNWKSPRNLVLCINTARVFNFTNFFSIFRDGKVYEISINLLTSLNGCDS